MSSIEIKEVALKKIGSVESNVKTVSSAQSLSSLDSNGLYGVKLDWSNISYSVPVQAPRDSKETKDSPSVAHKTLLYPMNGSAEPGEILAIMGTSGAGKSTLLDILAGRLESKDLKGKITANGSILDKKKFRKSSGYVMQSDALYPLLTVRETIRFAAYLRVSGKTVAEKNDIAEATIKLLRLEDCVDTIVGNDDNRGISGGQKRRVSVAVDIVHSPSVIFLDEPTSGLDSSTAFGVVESLKELAISRGCTIVMTIHQPSARLFNLLDRVIFLAAGRVTYNGAVGDLQAYINQTAKLAGYNHVTTGSMPEIFLDICDDIQKNDQLHLVTNNYQGSELSEESNAAVEAVPYANSFLQEVSILVSRGLSNTFRTPELFFARVGASCGFGTLVGTLFLFPDESILGVQHKMSYFVFIVAFFYYTSLEALPIFLAEREIFQREYSRGAYRASSFTLASAVVTWPFLLMVSLLFSFITYWLLNLPNTASIFFFHVFTVFTILVAGSGFATAMSAVVPNPMAGQTAGSALLSVMFLFSGFFIKSGDIPDYWIWLHYMSLFKYAFESLIINDLHNYTIPSLNLSNQDVLKLFDMDGINYGRGVGVLWLFIIFFRLVFWYRLTTAFNGSRSK